MTVSMTILSNYVQRLAAIGAEVTYWNRSDSYNLNYNVRSCDAFILVLPGNAFTYQRSELPIGCRRELETAVCHRRKIYIAHTTYVGAFVFYNTTINSQEILGIGSSSYGLCNAIGVFDGLKIHTSFEESIKQKSGYPKCDIPNPCLEILSRETHDFFPEQHHIGEVVKLTWAEAINLFAKAMIEQNQDRRLLL